MDTGIDIKEKGGFLSALGIEKSGFISIDTRSMNVFDAKPNIILH